MTAATRCASPDPGAAPLQRLHVSGARPPPAPHVPQEVRHPPPWERATYSLSCSWLCRAARSPVRLCTAPRRRSLSCRCTVGLDAEGVREADLTPSEAWGLALSIELSFWR